MSYGKVSMRLDTLGKPPLLQVVTEAKAPKKLTQTEPVAELRQVAGTSPKSSGTPSQDQGKLGQILELLAKNKRLNKRRLGFVTKHYKKVEGYLEAAKVGSRLDISG